LATALSSLLHAHRINLTMNILVTGANGFVGKALCKSLNNTEHQIAALSRYVVASNVNKHYMLTTLDGNTNYTHPLNGIDVVIHLAGRAHVLNDKSIDPYQAYAKVNIEATKSLALQAAASGVKRFIFISSVKVNGEETTDKPFSEHAKPNPQDDYGKTKLEAEQALSLIAKGTGMDVVIIRPPLIYGKGVKANFKHLIQLCQKPLPLPFGAIQNKRSMIYIDNLVDFIMVCITHPNAANETFLISDDADVSTTNLIKMIRQALDVPILLMPIPQSWLEFFLRLMGKKNLDARLCGNLQIDISKAKKMLRWKPPISIEDGLKATVIGFKSK
jgi:nucleoside-diphosphate-sugar epimerase